MIVITESSKMAMIENIPFDVLVELIKYFDLNTLKAFRVIVFTNRVLKEVFYTWITQEMEKRVVLKVTESKIKNLASPMMVIGNSNYDIAIDIPIERSARNIVDQVVTEHKSRIKEVTLFEDTPYYFYYTLPKLEGIKKLRVIGYHYSEAAILLITSSLFQNNNHLTTIELTFVKFPSAVFFSRKNLPNVINLKLTECEGAGAESLLEAVDLTLLKFELTDCNSNFMIPESVEMPNIRELSITTMYGVMTLELNLTKVGRTLEKLVVKGGVIFSPGVPLNKFPNVKTLMLDSCNLGSAQELLDACADSVTAIELVGMNLGCVGNSFPNLEYLILYYCGGDLGELLQRGVKISTMDIREFTHDKTLEKMVSNLKSLTINGKEETIGKAPILYGGIGKETEVRSYFDHSAT